MKPTRFIPLVTTTSLSQYVTSVLKPNQITGPHNHGSKTNISKTETAAGHQFKQIPWSSQGHIAIFHS